MASPHERCITHTVFLVDIATFYFYQTSYNLDNPEEGYTVLPTKQRNFIEIGSAKMSFLGSQEDFRGYVVTLAVKQLQRQQFCAIRKLPFCVHSQVQRGIFKKGGVVEIGRKTV